MLFFDTSALVKRYADEQGTQTVDRLIETTESTIIITSLSVIEIASAFRRKYNRGEISEHKRDGLLVSFFEEATERFIIIPVDENIFENAFDLVLEDDLRTLDSLQLAAVLTLPPPNPEITFVCADETLVAVAEQHGLSTNNPLS
jgi:predicted nucleic acid-binding protein